MGLVKKENTPLTCISNTTISLKSADSSISFSKSIIPNSPNKVDTGIKIKVNFSGDFALQFSASASGAARPYYTPIVELRINGVLFGTQGIVIPSSRTVIGWNITGVKKNDVLTLFVGSNGYSLSETGSISYTLDTFTSKGIITMQNPLVFTKGE